VGINNVYDLLPAPFDWIEIPSGEVTVQGKTETPPAFHIAKYPITNAQYAKFIESDGYNQPEWWTTEGWQKRKEGDSYQFKSRSRRLPDKPWIEPRYWQDARWKGEDHPVVGISWYETLAFCCWLSSVSNLKIVLPTEYQWQRAAQGDDSRLYPWGNDWDNNRCNNSVKRFASSATSRVLQYEGIDKGNSPFGVVDMVGNVWEWCASDKVDKTEVYAWQQDQVLRGGSWWASNPDHFRVDYRYSVSPATRLDSVGFRLACA
jgi:formylglycine-generating enzyme required for sulfatase activity